MPRIEANVVDGLLKTGMKTINNDGFQMHENSKYILLLIGRYKAMTNFNDKNY